MKERKGSTAAVPVLMATHSTKSLAKSLGGGRGKVGLDVFVEREGGRAVLLKIPRGDVDGVGEVK